MFKKATLVLAALSIFLVAPAFAKDKESKCKEKDVVGSYVSADPSSLPIPLDYYVPGFEGVNGTRDVTYVFQLILQAGGTATLDWTGRSDYKMTEGTVSTYHGNWECRKDGTLLLTTIGAAYVPTDYNPYQDREVSDIQLAGHNRHNRLFSVDDEDTITMVQSVRRYYFPDQDPTDPLDGFPRPLTYPDIVFTRLAPSTEGLDLP
jgi:hypothetical protein